MESQLESLIIELIEHIDRSKYDALYSRFTRHEMKSNLLIYLSIIRSKGSCPAKEIELMMAPTGCIQELAIDNNWSEEYIQISEKIDKIIMDNY